MANFGLTATSLFEIWTPVWSSASTSHFHKGIFLSLTEWYSFPWVCFSFLSFFFFFYQGLYSVFDFLISNHLSISKKLLHVNFVKSMVYTKYGNNMKNKPQDERIPQKFSQVTCQGPRLWHLPQFLTFIWKDIFVNILGTFKDFRDFFWKH